VPIITSLINGRNGQKPKYEMMMSQEPLIDDVEDAAPESADAAADAVKNAKEESMVGSFIDSILSGDEEEDLDALEADAACGGIPKPDTSAVQAVTIMQQASPIVFASQKSEKDLQQSFLLEESLEAIEAALALGGIDDDVEAGDDAGFLVTPPAAISVVQALAPTPTAAPAAEDFEPVVDFTPPEEIKAEVPTDAASTIDQPAASMRDFPSMGELDSLAHQMARLRRRQQELDEDEAEDTAKT
jgi:hypothetical protein